MLRFSTRFSFRFSFFSLLVAGAAVLVLPAATPAAHAQQSTIYTDSTLFLASVAPNYYTETFDGVSSGPSLSYSRNGYSYTVTAASAGGDPDYAVGTNSGFIGANTADNPLTITFSSGNVSAVGGNFFQTDISYRFQTRPVTLHLSDGTTTTFTPANRNASYRGFTTSGNTVLTSITFDAANIPDVDLFPTLDNLTVGTKISPSANTTEPGSLALVGLGALPFAASAARRLRRRKSFAAFS